MDAVGGTTREAAIDKESDPTVDAERTMSVPRSRAIASLFEGDAGRVRALIARFKGQRLRLESEIRGWSMSGSLPAGSRIQIRCESLAGLGVGDVVAIVFGTTLVAHRIAYVGRCGASKGIVITRGDATMLVDAPAADTDIVGRVIAVDSGAGWVDVAGQEAACSACPGRMCACPRDPAGTGRADRTTPVAMEGPSGGRFPGKCLTTPAIA